MWNEKITLLDKLWFPMGGYCFRADFPTGSLLWWAMRHLSRCDYAEDTFFYVSPLMKSQIVSGSQVSGRKSYNIDTVKGFCFWESEYTVAFSTWVKGSPPLSHVIFVTFLITLCFPRFLSWFVDLYRASIAEILSSHLVVCTWSNYTS